jgi:hypothetical protein
MLGTCVIHIVFAPLGVEPLERFAASYKAHAAGTEHHLVLVPKGAHDAVVATRCRELAEEIDAEQLVLPARGLDLDTYRAAANHVRADVLCFLNSSSEILAPGWLTGLRSALELPGVGLVGATGSEESALSAAPRPLRPLLRRRYPPFPNPHVRTNGFMLERELMLAIDWPETTRKRRALALESGVGSLTRQVWNAGLNALVVGRDGVYERDRWHESRTFRSGSQENLLIADNRTRQYREAGPVRRAQLARLAWGEVAELTSAPRAPARPA